jgi:ABC-type glycerol-3-phosphate transport system permease component
MDKDKRLLGLLGTLSRNVLLVFYALFALFPLIWMLILSFKPDDQMSTTTFIFSPTLDNFRAVLGQEGFLKTLWNNLLVSSSSGAVAYRWGARGVCVGKVSVQGEDIAFNSSLCVFLRKSWSSFPFI